MVNADRLGYDAYAIIEHYFFEKFSISSNPTAMFAAAAQRTKDIRFRTMLHALPYHNPTVLASVIHATHLLTGGRYEWGVGRGHGWIPEKAGVKLDEDARPRYEEAVELLLAALDNEEFSYHGEVLRRRPLARRPVREGALPRLPRRAPPTGRTRSRPSAAGASPCRHCCPTRCSRPSSISTARRVPRHGTTPDIVWIHACHLDEDREHRRARGSRVGHRVHPGELLAAHRAPEAADRRARSPRATASTRPGSWKGSPRSPTSSSSRRTTSGSAPPPTSSSESRRRWRCARACTEIGITVNAGGAPHWMAIKNQELFAQQVMPHFQGAA